MTEQLTPLSAEELTEIRDYYTAQIIPECPVRGDDLIVGRVLQMLDEHTRLGSTVRALKARLVELEGRQCENCDDWSSEKLICYSGRRGINSLCELWERCKRGGEQP